MNYMKRISLIMALIAAFLALPAWAQKVETDYDHAVSFSLPHLFVGTRAYLRSVF